jgi:FdhD protein
VTVQDDDALADSVGHVAVVRVTDGSARAQRDAVAREEPLEIQVRGSPLAVVMRTPGHDADLALGFLASER